MDARKGRRGRLIRRILITLPVLITGCTAFGPMVLTAGQSYCTGDAVACEKLAKVAEELHTPEMVQRICEAGADAPECRK